MKVSLSIYVDIQLRRTNLAIDVCCFIKSPHVHKQSRSRERFMETFNEPFFTILHRVA